MCEWVSEWVLVWPFSLSVGCECEWVFKSMRQCQCVFNIYFCPRFIGMERHFKHITSVFSKRIHCLFDHFVPCLYRGSFATLYVLCIHMCLCMCVYPFVLVHLHRCFACVTMASSAISQLFLSTSGPTNYLRCLQCLALYFLSLSLTHISTHTHTMTHWCTLLLAWFQYRGT